MPFLFSALLAAFPSILHDPLYWLNELVCYQGKKCMSEVSGPENLDVERAQN